MGPYIRRERYFTALPSRGRSKSVEIEGPTVRLRPIDHADAQRIHRWYEDPELVAPYDRYEADSFAEFEASLIASVGDDRSLAPRFAVVRRTDGQTVGCVGHYLAHPVLEYVDVWYVLGDPSARGHGFGSEAVTLLVGHLF